jgi:uncharacterized protein
VTTLVDAGPLIALIDRGEPEHDSCVLAMQELVGPLLTTWAVFTEAMYLLGAAGGWVAQEVLWRLSERDDLHLAELDAPMRKAARALMEKYSDVPMDLADATLVALGQSLEVKRVFTLDKDFHIYRFKGKQAFEVIPSA